MALELDESIFVERFLRYVLPYNFIGVVLITIDPRYVILTLCVDLFEVQFARA